MKTLDDIADELRRWGFWQRSNTRTSLNYVLMSCSVGIGQSNVTPVYRDKYSENLDVLIRQNLEKNYRRVLILSFVDELSTVEAAIKMNMARTTFKAKRREAMAMLIGMSCDNRLDRTASKP